ncbi:MAG: sulfatase-like hydrolase/transferase [Clostridia bacterium]|nr:sulfatase-like hydrolase/transferase [Clostridia bacterium]
MAITAAATAAATATAVAVKASKAKTKADSVPVEEKTALTDGSAEVTVGSEEAVPEAETTASTLFGRFTRRAKHAKHAKKPKHAKHAKNTQEEAEETIPGAAETVAAEQAIAQDTEKQQAPGRETPEPEKAAAAAGTKPVGAATGEGKEATDITGSSDLAMPGQSRIRELVSILYLPITLAFYEFVFRISVLSGAERFALLPITLFSIVYGLLAYYLTSLTQHHKINLAVKAVLCFLGAVPFLVEFFIFRQFKMLYDVKTITASAADVAGSRFAGHALSLMTDANGLSHIIVFLIPTILLLFFRFKLDPCVKSTWKKRLAILAAVVIIMIVNAALIKQVDFYRHTYEDRYNYDSAIRSFGLVTGIRLDIQKDSSGAEGGFDLAEDEAGDETLPEEDLHLNEGEEPVEDPSEAGTAEAQAGEGADETAEPEPAPVYGKSEMDIDFAAIAERSGGSLSEIDQYVQSLKPSSQNAMTGRFKGKNLILITAEAFSAEAIDPERTPTLYRMATRGINFLDYYQQATSGTIGGEYQSIFGLLPTSGGASFEEAADNLNYFTMGTQLDKLGYYGQAFHNNDYTYYSRHITHNSLGYSEGYMGVGNGLEEKITKQWPESDLEMMRATVDMYINKQPFNIYYMTVSGHSKYSFAANAMARKNQASVEGMDCSEAIASYLAANVELDLAMKYLIDRLEEAEIADDTVICLTADHFPYGLDDDAALGKMPYLAELYGYEVTNYFERDHNRLLLWCGELEKEDPIIIRDPVSSIDILPTLCNLFGTEWDSRLLPGRDVFSDAPAIVFNMNYDWKTPWGTYLAWTNSFTPADPASTTDWTAYVDRMNKLVKNKINYCSAVLKNDYYRHLFGE